jgi:threonine aldolase
MGGYIIDLRSDTVTQPTEEMRQAAFDALVGDDGFGEDPTVDFLEQTFAARVGKEAAVFVPSGVMANQIALRILTQPGESVVTGERNHVVGYELGAAGRNSQVQFHTLPDDQGYLDFDAIAEAMNGKDHHLPTVGAIFIENTHMASGGRVWPIDRLRELGSIAKSTPIHLDGARLFNAEVATGISAAELSRSATTVMACLSKGLSAPVGSLLAGPQSLMKAARIERKRLGGAMRQVGVIAAPGIVALHTMVDRLKDDHRRAGVIREAVAARFPECAAFLEGQVTNIIAFHHPEASGIVTQLGSKGILAGTVAPSVVRLVTHRHIDDEAVHRTEEAIRDLR